MKKITFPSPFTVLMRKRTLLLLGSFLIMALVLVLNNRSAAAAPGKTTMVNLSSEPIWVAYGVMRVPDSNGGAVPQGYINFGGWYKVEPGRARDFPANAWVRVHDDGRNAITWNNKNEKVGIIPNDSRGFPHDSTPTLTYSNRGQNAVPNNLNQALAQGYVRAIYQQLPSNRYNVTGDRAYEVRQQSFNFNFESRDPKSHSRCFPVSGNVVDYGVTDQRLHGPSVDWDQYSDKVCVYVVTRGHQPYAGATREKGYYRGNVTVHYTVRKQSSGGSSGSSGASTLQLSAGFTPDPFRVNVRAIGVSSKPASTVGSNCRGYLSIEPAKQLQWSGSSERLRVYVTSAEDTVLVIRHPNGRYSCSDDWKSGDKNPMLNLWNPSAGIYKIWVGTFEPNKSVHASLYFSELNRDPSNP